MRDSTAAVLLVCVGLGGCSAAEQAGRSAAEDAAREAVERATAGAVDTEAARERAQDAVDGALDSLPGTCADVLAVPDRTRREQAEAVLGAFWLSELSTEQPSAEQVDAFAEAVVTRCEDSKETDAGSVLRDVWATGDHLP